MNNQSTDANQYEINTVRKNMNGKSIDTQE